LSASLSLSRDPPWPHLAYDRIQVFATRTGNRLLYPGQSGWARVRQPDCTDPAMSDKTAFGDWRIPWSIRHAKSPTTPESRSPVAAIQQLANPLTRINLSPTLPCTEMPDRCISQLKYKVDMRTLLAITRLLTAGPLRQRPSLADRARTGTNDNALYQLYNIVQHPSIGIPCSTKLSSLEPISPGPFSSG